MYASIRAGGLNGSGVDIIGTPKPGTGKPEAEARNLEPGTGNPKSETCSSEPETRNSNHEAEHETQNTKPET